MPLPSPATPIQPALFEDRHIRREWHNGEWHFAVVDVVEALTDSRDPADYLKKLKRRDSEFAKGWGQNVPTLSVETAGGKQKLRCATVEGIFRLIQAIPSVKAEPFKAWMARTAAERLKEEVDPGLAVDRAIRRYRQKGLGDAEIKARIDGILARNSLTAAWKARGISKSYEYANLTNALYVEAFGHNKKGLCHSLGVAEDANPREAMGRVALSLLNLGEVVAEARAAEMNASGYYECKEAAVIGGSVARGARLNIEALIGKPVLPAPAQAPLPLPARRQTKKKNV
jgi:DNA-damage-inducible protein D